MHVVCAIFIGSTKTLGPLYRTITIRFQYPIIGTCCTPLMIHKDIIDINRLG
ncbi:hypothetical protein ACFP3I_06800 [Chryseobacterium arachidis]|uniref:hypothetical protein n=1 Tax=Chryseobacterium arachidis TaxID=1416778 RepID=UPI0036204169